MLSVTVSQKSAISLSVTECWVQASLTLVKYKPKKASGMSRAAVQAQIPHSSTGGSLVTRKGSAHLSVEGVTGQTPQVRKERRGLGGGSGRFYHS